MHNINSEPPSTLAAPRRGGQASTGDWRSRMRRATLAATGSLLAAAAVAVPASAARAQTVRDHAQQPVSYAFETLDDQADPRFNQLLGINNNGVIAGYFGSGMPASTHPNKGYTLDPPYGQANYVNENFPGSQQTQVTGINNKGTTVGFWADAAGDNFGFVDRNGRFTDVVDPHGQVNAGNGMTTEQLLGVNNQKVAVGFWVDANGNSHGFLYNVHKRSFTEIRIPGSASVTPTAINNDGKVVGFYVDAQGQDVAFVRSSRGQITALTPPAGATTTMALGINNEGEVVGSYMDATGATHGFTWTRRGGYTTIDDPNGMRGANAETVVNGVNDQGQLVGFYLDDAGNTDGMLAQPGS
jgi:probable HAF family extracellular repeat protein